MRLAFFFLLVTSSIASPPSAAVHATLVSSEPAANSHLASSPTRVRLVFSEPVEGKLGRISLHPGAGEPITLRAGADPRDVHAVLAPVDALAPGRYRVEWRVVSADGHPVDGTFVFAVGDTTLGAAAIPSATTPEPAPEPAAEPETEADTWGPSVVGAPLIPALLRGAGLGALMAAAGLLLLHVGAAPNAAQRTDAGVRRLTTSFAVLAPLLLGAHMVAWLINTSPEHRLDAAWASSALGTIVGEIELWRTGLALLALWAWWLARRPAIALVLAAAALAVSGASGHSAAIQPEWGVPAKAIHLLASAVWLGGLLWLVVRPKADDVTLFAHDAERVSARALIAVIAVAFTGVVQTRLFLPSWGALVSSAYGALALAKAAGLLVLIAFGAYHRQRLMPRVAAAARSMADVTALRGSVAREIVVMAVVILLGGLLAYVPPPDEAGEPMSSHQTTS
jgi:copper transport protein